MSDIILGLNKKLNGLLLVEHKNGFLVIDTSVRANAGCNYDVCRETVVVLHRNYEDYTTEWMLCKKIIFASEELGLVDVPLIHERGGEIVYSHKQLIDAMRLARLGKAEKSSMGRGKFTFMYDDKSVLKPIEEPKVLITYNENKPTKAQFC